MTSIKMHILVCGGTGCVSSRSLAIVDALRSELDVHGLAEEVKVVVAGCFGFCEKGPIVKISPDNTFYVQVTPEDAKEIVAEHIVKGRKVDRLLYVDPKAHQHISDSKHMDFYKKQLRVALRNCGFIDPENIGEYIARDGYMALGKALFEMTPKDVVVEIKKSGLRGRGGGGFPTGLKWEIAASYDADQKYVVCNADEGDPGAFMDRSLLEGDPHSIVEAMAICGYAIGADKGVVYIRAEYPLAVERLRKAIEDARETGMLGNDILGSGFSFDIDIYYGAGAFVCGEETALIRSLESERGEPTNKPPFPAESGFWGKPSNVNNVETFANIPVILLKGADWFASIGTEKSKGTKVFALAGKVNNVGLVEVPMGTTLREVIFDIGGGIRDGKKFKAAQTGGPSGGCLTERFLDTPIDYDNLLAAGSMMGSGGMIVLDEDNCMVDVAKFYLGFTVEESCGKCTPCRVGNRRMLEILEKISDGRATEKDLNRLRELATIIKDTSLCGLGQTAPNPVLSTLENFPNEYRAHVVDKRCPSGKCKSLVEYFIDPEKCKGCTMCAKACPADAISGKVKSVHVIDREKCVKCGACISVCKFDAVVKRQAEEGGTMITLNIDGKQIAVPKGTTILDAAKKLDIDIPTLCHLDLHEIGIVNKSASCRICVVEVKGRRNLAPACSTPVSEGMEVRTNTVRVLNARKVVLELLLSDHPKDCLTCAKSGECELQDLAERFCLRETRYEGAQSTYRKDVSPAIERNMDKCIMCRRCETMCNEVQTVGALSGINRGFDAVVAPAFDMPLEESVCTFCGQCVAVCPTGALVERDYSWEVIEALANPDKVVLVQTAPAIRAALGECFGMEPGTLVTGKMVSALRQMGFDYVFDTDFAADLTIMEEGAELLDRVQRFLAGDKSVRLPILTSCCPAWVKFFEHQYPDLLDVPSSAKSPQQMFGAVAKTYLADKLGVPREKLVVVSVMPCLAKKYECARPEFSVDGNPDVDISISTRELAHLIKRANIDFLSLPDEDFDSPMGESTGAAVIFGTTGGVIEAATRTAVELLTGTPLENVNFTALRGLEGCREAKVQAGDLELHIGIAHELGNARKLLDAIKKGTVEPFHAIEIMACPGGCIGGGGQPYHHGCMDIIKKRQAALYREDEGKARRKSHENPDIVKLYKEFLGKPLGEKAHHLLHTHYFKRHSI